MKLLLATLFLLSPTTYSATTGSLLLQGIVPAVRSVTVTPETVASTLDLATTQTNLKVATINEKSNSVFGYKLTITSVNLSNLKRTTGVEVFPYTIKYNGVSAPVTSVSGYSVNSNSFPTNVNKDLTISYTGVPAEQMTEGTYTDTLTFTISAQ